MTSEMFASAVRSAGDYAGVFEYAEQTGYFYLYDQRETEGQRIVGAIHMFSGKPDFHESDVEVRWSANEESVGLFLCGQLWAVFRGRETFGGDYRRDRRPQIPQTIAASFVKGR